MGNTGFAASVLLILRTGLIGNKTKIVLISMFSRQP